MYANLIKKTKKNYKIMLAILKTLNNQYLEEAEKTHFH